MTSLRILSGTWTVIGRVLRPIGREMSGIATLEFALIAPLLGLILFGVLDYGLVSARKMALANAVRAGAQYAMIRRPIQGDVSAIRQAVLNAAPEPKIGVHDAQVTLFCECPDGTMVADCDPGSCAGTTILSFVDIVLAEQYPLMLPYPGFANPLTLGERVTVRLN